MEVLKKCAPLWERKNNKNSECSPLEWDIRGVMGESSVFGEVYLACCKQNCDHVMKIQKVPTRREEGETSSESEIQYLMAEKGIAPKILYSNICGGNSVIIMESLEKTAWEFMEETKDPKIHKKILKKIVEILEKMHSLGYIHGDAHLNNFMLAYDKKEYKKILRKNFGYEDLEFRLYAIDFGKSEISEDFVSDFEKLAIDLIERYEDSEWTLGEEKKYTENIEMVLKKIEKSRNKK